MKTCKSRKEHNRGKKKYLKIVAGVEVLCCCINKGFFHSKQSDPGSALAWPSLAQSWAGFSSCLRTKNPLPALPEPDLCQCLWERPGQPRGCLPSKQEPLGAEPEQAAGRYSHSPGSSHKAAGWGKETYDNTHKQVLGLKRKIPPPLMSLFS